MAITFQGYKLTTHAQQRRKQMNLTEARIDNVLLDPVLDIPSTQHSHRRLAFGDDIVVVYEPRKHEVVTVLWRSDDVYFRGDRSTPPARP